MNKNIYNLVFRPDIGDYVVASEISRTKKPGLKQIAKTAGRSLGGIIILCTLSLTGYGKQVWAVTDIVVDPSAPANQRPQIIYSANGTPQVNIQKPSNAGISTSQYLTFDVGSDGLIINNARQNAQTEIGGWVQANPWLARGEAKVILSQVNSDQISRLHGYVEIAGSKADLVIANPSGIHINGGGFINTNRSILTTGTPVFNETGSIGSFLVERGDITVDGKGLDARFSNYTDILSHAVQINAEIWADELQIIAGSNHISYDLQEITPQANDHSPAFALDVSVLGGMYANKIRMIGTSEGMGVNQQGMLYSQGEITLSAEGKLINTGILSAEGSITLVSDHTNNASGYIGGSEIHLKTGGMDNSNGSLRAETGDIVIVSDYINNTTGYIGGSAIHLETGDMDNSNGSLRAETSDLVINAKNFTNDNSRLMAGGNLEASVSSMKGSGLFYAMESIGIKSKESLSGNFQIAAGHNISLASGRFFNGDKSFILAGVDRDLNFIRDASIDIESDSYFIFSGQAMTQGAFNIKSLDVNLSNSQIKAGDLYINVMRSSVIDTRESIIHVDGLFDLKSSLNKNYQLNNRDGYIEADRFNVQVSALSNVDGHIIQLGNNDFFFDLGHYFGSGSVHSFNPLETNVFDNTNGIVYLGSPDSKIIAKDILNYQGFIGHHGKGAFQMTADTFYGSYGAVQSDGRLIFSAINAENKNGLIQAGDISLNIRELENQSGKIYSQDSITAHFSEFNNDYGLMEAETGHVNIHSDIFYNGYGQLYSYSDMNLNAREFSSAGHVFSDANINIEAAEWIENKGVIVSGKDINLTSKGVENKSSGLLAAGQRNPENFQGNLNIFAEEHFSSSGQHLAGNKFSVEAKGIHLGSSVSQASNINLNATEFDIVTSYAALEAVSHLGITANQNLDQKLINVGGSLSGSRISIDTFYINNTSGKILQTSSESGFNLDFGADTLFNNTRGYISTGSQDLKLTASNFINHSGVIEHLGYGHFYIDAANVESSKGKLVSRGYLELNTDQLNNDYGLIQGRSTYIHVGQLNNRYGSILQSGTNHTYIHADRGFSNVGGNLVTQGALDIRSNALFDNQQGLMAALSDIHLDIHELNNERGEIISTAGDFLMNNNRLLNNASGLIQIRGDLNVRAQGIRNERSRSDEGGLIQADSIHLDLGSFNLDNSYGALISGTSLDIESGELNNDSGLITAKEITAKTEEVLSYEGEIYSFGSLLWESTSVDNRLGSIHADEDIEWNTQSWLNQEGSLSTAGSAKLEVKNELDNTEGLISALETLHITSNDQRTLQLNNESGQLVALDEIRIYGESLSHDGEVITEGDFHLNLAGDYEYNDQGHFLVGGDLEFRLEGTLRVSDHLQSGKELHLQVQNLDNLHTGTLSSGVLKLNVDQHFKNHGLIDGDQVFISAGTLDNISFLTPVAETEAAETTENAEDAVAARIYADQLWIDARTLNNKSVIASRGDLFIGAGTLLNDIDARLVSLGNMSIGGNVSDTGQVTGQAATISNRSALIEAHGNLQIAANSISNSNEDFSTIIEVVSGPEAYTFILPEGWTEKFPEEDFEHRSWSRAGKLQFKHTPSVLLPDGLAGQFLDTVGEMECNEDAPNPADECVLVGGNLYTKNHEIWSFFNISTESLPDNWLYLAVSEPVKAPNPIPENSCDEAHPDYSLQACSQYQLEAESYQNYTHSKSTMETLNNRINSHNSNLERLVGQIKTWNIIQADVTVSESQVDRSAPGTIQSGGSMSLNSQSIINDKSYILAGGSLQLIGGEIQNIEGEGEQITHEVGTTQRTYGKWRGGFRRYHQRRYGDVMEYSPADVIVPIDVQVTRVEEFAFSPAASPVPDFSADTAIELTDLGQSTKDLTDIQDTGLSQIDAQSLGDGLTVSSQTSDVKADAAATPLQAPNLQNATPEEERQITGQASTVGDQVRTVQLQLTAPRSGMFSIQSGPQQSYLVETDPQFINSNQWLGSDYMLEQLAIDPQLVQKRIGDAFYEQEMIKQQVRTLTGQRYLGQHNNDEDQYRALMQAGVRAAERLNLRPGIALTAEQMAQLTDDIVWLVEQTITLADGQTQQVLVPQVYARPQPGDLLATGSLMAGRDVEINASGEFMNQGTLASRNQLSVNAQNLVNQGGNIQAGQMFAQVEHDFKNLGGNINLQNGGYFDIGRNLEMLSESYQVSQQVGESSFDRGGISRIAGLSTQNAHDSLIIRTGGDMNFTAAQVDLAGSGQFVAGGNIHLNHLVTTNEDNMHENKRNYVRVQTTDIHGSQINAGGSLLLDAQQQLIVDASSLKAEQDLQLRGMEGVQILAAQSQASFDSSLSYSGSMGRRTTQTTQVNRQDWQGSELQAGDNLIISSDSDLLSSATRFFSENGLIALQAGGDINLAAVQQQSSETHTTSKRSFGFLNSTSRANTTITETSQAIGNSLDGNQILINAGNNLNITTGQLVAEQDLILKSGQDIQIAAGESTYSQTTESAKRKSGLIGSGLSLTLGSQRLNTDQQYNETIAAASTLGSLEGNINIQAGNQYTQVGSDLIALGGDISVKAQDIAIIEAREATQTTQQTRFKQSGLTLALESPIIDAVQAGQQMHKASQNTDSGRMQALAAGATALNFYNNIGKISEAVTALASGDAGSAVSISLTVGSSRSSSDMTQTSNTARGSSLNSGGNINLVASGGGDQSNLLIQGSDINAANNLLLQADNQINVLAAQNHASQESDNKSSSAGVGVGISLGSEGFAAGITVSASAARGNADGEDLYHTNSQIKAGSQLHIQSGGDTQLIGAVAQGEQVTADIGGNLTLQSQQDTSRYDSKNQSASGSGTFGFGGASVSATYSQSEMDASYASVNQQSGIHAGDGGFQLKVAGDTELTGAVITSTDEAIAQNKNSLQTENIHTQDINNHSRFSAEAFSVGTGGAGYGSDGEKESSVTQSGISGLAGNTEVRTGDASTGLKNNFDADKVQKEIDAQVAITGEFGKQAPKAWGDYASSKRATLTLEAMKESDPERRQALVDEAAKWDEGGSYHLAGHAAIGGLSGGMNGTLATTGSVATMSQLGERIDHLDLPEAVKSGLNASFAAGLGAITGDLQGATQAINSELNNRQLHSFEKAMATELAKDSPYTPEQIENALRAMSNQELNEIPGSNIVVNENNPELAEQNNGVATERFDEDGTWMQTGEGTYVQLIPKNIDPALANFILSSTGGEDSPYHWEAPKKAEPVDRTPKLTFPGSIAMAAGLNYDLNTGDTRSEQQLARDQEKFTMGMAQTAALPVSGTYALAKVGVKGTLGLIGLGAGFDAAGQIYQGEEYRPGQTIRAAQTAVTLGPLANASVLNNTVLGGVAGGATTEMNNYYYNEDKSTFWGVLIGGGTGGFGTSVGVKIPNESVGNFVETTIQNYPSFFSIPDKNKVLDGSK